MLSRTILERATALRPMVVANSSSSSSGGMSTGGRSIGRAIVAASGGRTFSGSARTEHKESTSQHPDAQIDKHALDSLKKQKEGVGHWKAELASDSEEAVRADRAEHDPDPAKLQERTKHAAEETSKAGTSVHDGL